MKEADVVTHVKKWLRKNGKSFLTIFYVDFLVFRIEESWKIDIEQIECKGTDSDSNRAIGQCLKYYHMYDSIPTYLAVPRDYKFLVNLKQVIDFSKLPIGLLLVDELGQISMEKEANGRIRWHKLYHAKIEDSTLTYKSTHPKLHYAGK